MSVKAWQEDVIIPTYEIGKAEKNPIFLEKRVYQGSSGVVYPYPVVEKIADEKCDKTYKAVFLENEYIKVMILPELGGRVQMAYDKIKKRHFIYFNQVIKPALVGLTGPWISGGIEFNWPQHHRPSTFLPVDYTIENNADGSVTVWVSENEKMFHQKGMAGFTLHLGKAYLEIKGKLYNPTPVPQTFLWWANPAVAVNEHYQTVFPPDVHAVFDHGKRDVSTFPIATGTYYKIDYSAGVDISNYKNIPVPTSYMAINSEFNFVGGYENDTQAGVLHVASHHISPGKKQWTWGNGDFGKAWDRNLTDEDGPYIELMAGVYTDNQPDFSWMQPYEEKTFTQYFLPYRELGVVKNASQDLLLNMDKAGDKVIVKIFVTSKQNNARIDLTPCPLSLRRGEFEERGTGKWVEGDAHANITTDSFSWGLLIQKAKEMRHEPTEAENKLWDRLRNRKTGYKIRRQHIIQGFIADFFCVEKNVVIEVDGGIHLTPEQKEHDKFRTDILNSHGYTVIRYSNEEVLKDSFEVANRIKTKLQEIPSRKKTNSSYDSLPPSPKGEGSGVRFFSEKANLSPESVYTREIEIGNISLSELCLSVYTENGTELLAIRTEEVERPQAEAAKPSLSPQETPTCEQLYLTGLHLEQYRHATYNATDYYLEALRRDPSDVRNNNAMGLWLLRRGKFSEAESYFRKAIETQLQRNPNPYDGEPHYNLGLVLQFQGKLKSAYDAFYKSCWNAAMQDAGYLGCAQISCKNDKLTDALYEIDKSLIRNWHNHKARVLKTAILRKLDRKNEALELIADSLKIDLFNFGCRFEQYLLTNDNSVLAEMHQFMRGEIHNYEVVALDYIGAGLYAEAVQLLEVGIIACSALSSPLSSRRGVGGEVKTTPMTYYYMGWALNLSEKEAESVLEKAAVHAPEYCFPNRLEAILALECAQKVNPTDAKAPYYLGNLWYDKRQYTEAIACWEKSVKIDDTFPTVLRNLSLAYFNKLNQEAKALEFLEKAFSLDTTDARILMELDQLYKRLCRPHAERLAFLDKYFHLVEERDDVYLEYVTLNNQLGNYTKAIELIDNRIFHPWEGGEGKVPAQYQLARVELAKQFIAQNEHKKAIQLLNQCLEYPHNLGEGKLHGAQENDFHYWLGCAYEEMGQSDLAKKYWELAKDGNSEPAAAIFYNDQKPDKIFYHGLALLKLGRKEEAKTRFEKLIAFGEKHLNEQIKLDYFAVSLPDLLIWDDDLTYRNKIHCYYMLGLGYLGLGQTEKANSYLQKAAEMDVNHQGVQVHLL
jgi:very-short-patch-repair endonuclease/tetratricopeptide (TPR) repeat protein